MSLVKNEGIDQVPPGTDEQIAMRIRGYLSVKSTNNGMPVTFGIFCNDLCSLSIGKQTIVAKAFLSTGQRWTQQVIFKDTGLYPVEIIYAQNTNAAYLEWSEALSAQPEGPQMTALDTSVFDLIKPGDLYSATVDASETCNECRNNDDCSKGEFCRDGICQPCNLSDHCGPSCMVCPPGAPLCSANNCVACTNDSACGAGNICMDGRCIPMVPRLTVSGCSASGDSIALQHNAKQHRGLSTALVVLLILAMSAGFVAKRRIT